MEQTSAQKLSYNLETTFFPLLQSLKKFCLIINAFGISFFSLNNISHIESAFTTLSLSTKTVLMERMPTHEVNGRESQAILAMRTVM